MLQITKGKVNRALRVTIYGLEGIGKSTLASLFPNPVFMDVESGTDQLDVARIPKPASWEMIRQITADFRRDPQGFQTLVIDTADWAERYAIVEVCAQNNLPSLGGADDYGRSFNLLEEKWAKWLDSLSDICYGLGVHIVVLAHAMMRKFEQPEEAGAFDRWEMKLQKKPSAKMKEWSDMLLFVGYKTLVVATSKGKGATKKGTGGSRVIRTTHHPCWDAKNRYDLPNEIELTVENKIVLPTELYNIFFPKPDPAPKIIASQGVIDDLNFLVTPPRLAVTGLATITDQPAKTSSHGPPQQEPVPVPTGLPSNLIQLMEANDVTELDIRRVVAKKGYYPEETPITNYTTEFIEGSLVAAWDKVMIAINKLTEGV